MSKETEFFIPFPFCFKKHKKKPVFKKIILIILIKISKYDIITESIQLKGVFYPFGDIYEKAA